MVELSHVDEVLTLLAFMAGGVGFLGVALFLSRFLRPSKPNAEKAIPYESGEDPVGHANGVFNLRFYAVALLFLLFDVELVLLYPWATVYGDVELNAASNKTWGLIGLAEVLLFIGILALGLAYAWAQGFLNWAKPKPEIPRVSKPLPDDAYAGMMKGQANKR